MEKNIHTEKLPFFVRATGTVLRLISNYYLAIILAAVFILSGLLLDKFQSPYIYTEKAGSITAILGLLLTIKYRLLQVFSGFDTYYFDQASGGGIPGSHTSHEDIKATKYKAKTEATGIWLILIGSLLGVATYWVAIWNYIIVILNVNCL